MASVTSFHFVIKCNNSVNGVQLRTFMDNKIQQQIIAEILFDINYLPFSAFKDIKNRFTGSEAV